MRKVGYVSQDYDVHPRFPRLKKFLDFWSRNLDDKLHRVKSIASRERNSRTNNWLPSPTYV